MTVVTKSLEETYKLAEQFVEKITKSPDPAVVRDGALVVGLSGDLGSGKTSFAQGIARALGVTEHVTSPTFVIVKRYALRDGRFKFLVHIDAYRLQSGERESHHLRLEEIFEDSNNLILIEWPEHLDDTVPKSLVSINFKFVSETDREISSPSLNH